MNQYFASGVNSVIPRVINDDERGVFSTIPFDVQWSEMNIVTSSANVMRGNHFHRYSTELFVLIEGEIRVESAAVNDVQPYSRGLSSYDFFQSGDIFYISPFTWHEFQIIRPSKWFSMMSLPHTPGNLDIVRMD